MEPCFSPSTSAWILGITLESSGSHSKRFTHRSISRTQILHIYMNWEWENSEGYGSVPSHSRLLGKTHLFKALLLWGGINPHSLRLPSEDEAKRGGVTTLQPSLSRVGFTAARGKRYICSAVSMATQPVLGTVFGRGRRWESRSPRWPRVPGSRAARRSPPAASGRCVLWPHGGDAEPSSARAWEPMPVLRPLSPKPDAPAGSLQASELTSLPAHVGLLQDRPTSLSLSTAHTLPTGSQSRALSAAGQPREAHGARARTCVGGASGWDDHQGAWPEAGVRTRVMGTGATGGSGAGTRASLQGTTWLVGLGAGW